MIERLHLTAVILAITCIWAVLLVIDGVYVSIAWLHHLSVVTGVVLLLVTCFDRFAWRWRWLHSWFVNRPVVDGTWRAEIVSDWTDPATGITIAPLDGYMVVRQTFSRLSLRLITNESQSELLGAEILRADDGTYRIIGVYRNEPRLTVRDGSPIHYGGLVLQADGSPPTRLEGSYWTDRGTAGELRLSARQPFHVTDMTSANKLYAK